MSLLLLRGRLTDGPLFFSLSSQEFRTTSHRVTIVWKTVSSPVYSPCSLSPSQLTDCPRPPWERTRARRRCPVAERFASVLVNLFLDDCYRSTSTFL
jgi:hypothetical protein